MVDTAHAQRLIDLGLHPVYLAAPVNGIKNSGKAPLGGKDWNKHEWQPSAAPAPFADCNLGIQTGLVVGAPRCVVVLDCDSPEAIAWADSHVPSTPVVTRTGKGEHRYYLRPNAPNGAIGGKVKLKLPTGEKLDLDIKGDGGQCVASPSVHYTGAQYVEKEPWTPELLDSMPVWCPEWVGSRVKSAPKHNTSNLSSDSDTELQRPGLSQAGIRSRVEWALSRPRSLSGAGGMDASTVAASLRATLDGSTPIASEGHRGSALLHVTYVLCNACPEAHDSELVEYLTPALQATSEDWETNSDFGLPGALQKIQSARRKLIDSDRARLAVTAPQSTQVIPQSTATAPPASIGSLLVIAHPKSDLCWVRRSDGTYSEAWNKTSAYQYKAHEAGLAWADAEGVASWFNETDKGLKPKPQSQFFAEYSTPLTPSQHWISLAAQSNTYDPTTGVFTQCAAPLRINQLPPPRFDARIDHWFRLFAGSDTAYERGCDWLAALPCVDRPTTILAAVGVRDTGKGLLIDGASQLWHRGRAPAFASICRGDFQESLAKSPLLIADEYLPESGPGGVDIWEYLREFVTARSHTVNQKGIPICQVDGCARLIYASNKADTLAIRNANPTAKAALAERITYLKPGQACRDYLGTLDRDTLNSWVDGGLIAAHILWLNQNRHIQYKGRLLVEGNGQELIDLASNSGGPTGNLCEAICRFLSDPRIVGNSARDHWHIENGELWVSAKAFEDKASWEVLVPSLEGKRYSTSQLGSALAMLSLEKDRLRYVGAKSRKQVQATMYRIDLPQVFSFAERTGVADPLVMRGTLGGAVSITPVPATVTELPVALASGFVESTFKSESASTTTFPPIETPAPTTPTQEPEHPMAKAVKTPKWQQPAIPRAPEYNPPSKLHAMIGHLITEKPATPQAVRALCAPFIRAEQPALEKATQEGGHPMTYGRLIQSQRAYIRGLATGLTPRECADKAVLAWLHDKLDWTPVNAPVGHEPK